VTVRLPALSLSAAPRQPITGPTDQLARRRSYILAKTWRLFCWACHQVAWTPQALGGGKAVIRGGFAMFAAPLEIIGIGSIGSSFTALTLEEEGFSQTTQMTVTGNNRQQLSDSIYHSLESLP
jgi:hypothetical protein